MKQAIAGVSPAETEETTVMTVWPSVAQFQLGRLLGRACSIRFPDVYIFRLGNLIALAAIPLGLALYFFRLHPCIYGVSPYGVTYRLTNRRIQVRRNELHMNWDKLGRGIVLGAVFALIGLFLFPLIAQLLLSLIGKALGTEFSPGTIAVISNIAFLIGLVGGAVKGFVIGTARMLFDQEVKSLQLDRFDSIEIEVQPGEEWHRAGDLVFRDGDTETFRLVGVSRPETFRETCLKSHMAYTGVKEARERELAHA